MLVYSVISPHPPIIIPEIGGAEIEKVKKTISALESAAKELAGVKPEKIVIISPHTEHGFEVPLFYLSKYLSSDAELEKILVTNPSYEYYYELGKDYGKKIKEKKQRIAVVASGDLSHVLTNNGPYGFDPYGPKLDKIIVDAVKDNDVDSLLNISLDTLERGAECGLRSILFLFGVFNGTNYDTKVLSYEGPFGVGYIVATLDPEGDRK